MSPSPFILRAPSNLSAHGPGCTMLIHLLSCLSPAPCLPYAPSYPAVFLPCLSLNPVCLYVPCVSIHAAFALPVLCPNALPASPWLSHLLLTQRLPVSVSWTHYRVLNQYF